MSATKPLSDKLKSDLSHLLFAGPPLLFGRLGTGVFVVILWWIFLAIGAFLQEYRPDPHYDEFRERPKAFAIALVIFVVFYYAAYYATRWLA